MFAALDVHYDGTDARAACVLFRGWRDEHAVNEHVLTATGVAPYEPGSFYRRELPVLQEALALVTAQLHTIVVDGYVWLDPLRTRPGLGAHLYAALEGQVSVVGVAKTEFAGAAATEVLRGSSQRPLYVTSVGIDHVDAVAGVQSMHGAHRMPTLLRRVDALARGRAVPVSMPAV